MDDVVGLASLNGYGVIGGASPLAGQNINDLLADTGVGSYTPALPGALACLPVLLVAVLLGLGSKAVIRNGKALAGLGLLAALCGGAWGGWHLVFPTFAGIVPAETVTAGLGPYLLVAGALVAIVTGIINLIDLRRVAEPPAHRGIQPR